MLSYNAPDIATLRKVPSSAQLASSSSSTHSTSADESDSSSVSNQTKDTFLTDASSVDESDSPTRTPSPEPNHLSCYFPPQKSVRRSVSTNDMHYRSSLSSAEPSPMIPQRAPSHSKKAHEAAVQRKKSLQMQQDRQSHTISIHSRNTSSQSMRSSTQLRSSTSLRESSRGSLDFFRNDIDPSHPFGRELEQLSEVAEEFVDTVRDAEWEADAALMQKKGLVRFCANEYLQEIEPLFGVAAYTPMVSMDGGFF